MHIEELSSKTNNKYVNVVLSYEECRDISNALYHMQKTDSKYKQIYGKCKFLFDMVKHGNIQPDTIKTLEKECKSE